MQLIIFILLLISPYEKLTAITDISSYGFTIQDSTCQGGGIFCTDCDTAVANGCYYSDSNELLIGFVSCTPEYLGPGPQINQPSPLCFGAGVPHNMSWFAFEARSTFAEIVIKPFECNTGSGPGGLQSGVYDLCSSNGGQCIGGNPFCSEDLNPIAYTVDNITPGNIYYIFVDGCNGSECEYEITINQIAPCLIATPKEINFISSCPPLDSLSPYYRNADFKIEVTHFGDSPYEEGVFDDEDFPYPPDLLLKYHWKVIPPFNGFDSLFFTNEIDSSRLEFIFKENLENVNYTICLESVESQCDNIPCINCCINISLTDCGNDYDQDGFDLDVDCNDCDPAINPGAEEILDNGIDDDCDGNIQTTSIIDIESDNFNIYPNPFIDIIYFQSLYSGSFIVQIYNAHGTLIESQKSQNSIKLSHLPTGTYLLKIKFPYKDSIIVRKILKL